MFDVHKTKGKGWTRYSMNWQGRLLEGWSYDDGRPNVWAVDCTPVAHLPGEAGGVVRQHMRKDEMGANAF